MTSKEFVIWFSGYMDAIQSTPTQHQWDELKKKVQSVSDPIPFPFGGMLEEPLIPSKNPVNTYKPCEMTTNKDESYRWDFEDALDRYNNWYISSTSLNQPISGSNQLELEFKPK